MGKLDGKVAVITGAASGMGRATAMRFAKEGAAVVVADLNSQAGEATVSEIAAGGGRAVFQHTDVGSDDGYQGADRSRGERIRPARYHLQQCRHRWSDRPARRHSQRRTGTRAS